MPENDFSNLDNESFMSITTYKRSGQGVATPVWFAEADGRLYVMTQGSSWKVKRLKNNPQAEIAPCTASGQITGEAVGALAAVLPVEEWDRARQLLQQKYGLQFTFFNLLGRLRKSKNVFLEVRPDNV